MLLTEGIIIVAANLECQPSCITPNDNSSLKFEIMAKQLYVASQRVL